MNQNVKILGRRLYSQMLKDVAWLEDAQLIFLIFHTWLGRQTSRRGSRERNLETNVWKIKKKLAQRLIGKLHPSNLVNAVFYLVF